jgi:very-short-patch-repair endonuclease
MLNVAFTRPRDEVHVFHTAPIDAFAFADGRPGALGDWLRHCAAIQPAPRSATAGSRLGNVDSEFEANVAAALRGKGLRVLHQYPACGFKIDLVAERADDGARVAVECDGERYHIDEHGMLKVEDLERQAILERARWRVVRIPYRKWIGDPGGEVQRVLTAVDLEAKDPLNVNGNGEDGNDGDESVLPDPLGSSGPVTPDEAQRYVERNTTVSQQLITLAKAYAIDHFDPESSKIVEGLLVHTDAQRPGPVVFGEGSDQLGPLATL